jgi:hypothetical protein
MELLSKQNFVREVIARDGQMVVHLKAEIQPPPNLVLDLLVKEGFKIKCFKPSEVTLEDAFLKLTKGEVS